MLIQTRQQFDQLLDSFKRSNAIVFDVESTGLYLRHGDVIVGIALYTDYDSQTWYIPVRHGLKPNLDLTTEHGKRTQAYKDQQLYKLYLEKYSKAVQQFNVPLEWLEDLKSVWLIPKTHIAHNSQYDLTAMDFEGFPTPNDIHDTMSMLSVVNSDWLGNRKEGIIPKFLMPDTKQYEPGSRSLKWQARLWGLESAKDGVDELELHTRELLDQLSADLLESEGVKAKFALNKSTPAQVYLWMLEPSKVALYAEEDTRLTYLLRDKIYAHCAEWGDTELLQLYNDTTMACWTMSMNGLQLDTKRADEMIAAGEKHAQELTEEIIKLSGGLIHNPNSPQQVLAYLQAIGVDAKDTNKYTLRSIKDVPVVGKITELRTLNISLETFVKKWRQNAAYGRIYPSYNVGGAATGRLSSSDDLYGNNQNLPRVTEKTVVNPKRALLPPKGCWWVSIDYSALEVNVGAYIAETVVGQGQNMTLTNILLAGADMHSYAMKMSGIDKILLKGRTPLQYLIDNGYTITDEIAADPEKYFMKKIARQTQKTANFAIQYGASTPGIIKAVGCTKIEAQAMLDGFHKAFPAMGQALTKLQALAMKPRKVPNNPNKQAQYIRYPIEGVQLYRKYQYYPASQKTASGATWSPLKSAARGAMNSVIQGGGSLIVQSSIVKIQKEFGFARIDKHDPNVVDFSKGKVIPLTTVHDSFDFALRTEDLPIIPRIMEIMCDWNTYPKLKVSAGIAPLGLGWGFVQDFDDFDEWYKQNVG